MLYAVLTAILLLLVYLPSLWVRAVLHKHSSDLAELPGTGGELAEHLIGRFELHGIKVETADPLGDHFDPTDKTVRLTSKNFSGKSLTAVAVAAHEIGHAIQFHRGEKIFELRKKYLPTAIFLKRLGILILAAIPVIGILIKSTAAILIVVVLSLALQLMGALAYLIVLPEEWDASFNKALPILLEGEYIQPEQAKAVHSVLKAAALTYVAGALADIVNIGRWLIILRR